MFVTRPTPFIDSLGVIFFGKECSINDQVMFMKVLNDGIEELSNRPKEIIEEEDSK